MSLVSGGPRRVAGASAVLLGNRHRAAGVVFGPSGSAETTLLNIIGALDSPTEGRVMVAARDITKSSRSELLAFRRRGASFGFQTFSLFLTLTALKNVLCLLSGS